MKAKRTLLISVISIALLLALSLSLVACGGTNFQVKWTYESEQVTVEMADGSALPEKVAEGEQISFKVTAKQGYKVTSVKNNKSTLRAKDGVYTVTVTADAEIIVASEATIGSLVVKTKPTKLTYNAGETLDKTGMEVEVHYDIGTTEAVDNSKCSVVYNSGSAFAIGDDSFKISYSGSVSDSVSLDAAVAATFNLDLGGGTLPEGWVDGVKSQFASEITAGTFKITENKTQDVTSSVTIWYNAKLTKSITLPELTKGSDGDFVFKGWFQGTDKVTAITPETAASADYTATFKANLVALSKIELKDKEGKPYLSLVGTWQAAKTLKLTLFNGEVSPLFTTTSTELTGGSKGAEFTLEYDLTGITQDGEGKTMNDLNGKWITITLTTDAGSSEIDINDFAGTEVLDMDQSILVGKLNYCFATQDTDTEKDLRVYWVDYVTTFEMKMGATEDGDPTVTFTGKITQPYMDDEEMAIAGKWVHIDWWVSSSFGKFAPIDQEGNWTVTFTLTPEEGFTLATDGYAHFQIYDSNEGGTVIYKEPTSNDGNLLNSWCTNEDLEIVNVGLIENRGAIYADSKDHTIRYYVGMGKWGAIVVYGRDTTEVSVNQVGLEVGEGDVPYIVFSGFYGKYSQEELAAYIIDGEVSGRQKFTLEVTDYNEGAGTFVMKADISEFAAGRYYMHAGWEDEPGNLGSSQAKVDPDHAEITVGGKTYSFTEEWSCRQLLIV